MGRQTQLYLLPADTHVFEAELRMQLGARLLRPVGAEPVPSEMATSTVTVNGIPRMDCFLSPLGRVQVRFRQIESRQLWTIDSLRSEIVEFRGCHLNANRLKRGRLFYQTGFYNDDRVWTNKSAEFIEWAEKVRRLMKELFLYDRHERAVIGKDAAEWKNKGGVFEAL